ncbi:hypothetical protein EUGRSUZ_L00269 [Eucalyptus grandis]|uniref:Uncharacterized protein n=2 Tax=Eucalyptus grandis TaxID=71139 RepID=A0A058ZXZ3_EUCGR|nr:hypothetical protein EUGRSUZ_L00269 [Eucalyptus grandis]
MLSILSARMSNAWNVFTMFYTSKFRYSFFFGRRLYSFKIDFFVYLCALILSLFLFYSIGVCTSKCFGPCMKRK